MTAAKIIDASALAAVMFVEPECDLVAASISGARLFAPTLIYHELTNACLTKLRRHPEMRFELLSQFELLQSIPIECRSVDPVGVLELAESRKLSAYDASYLWLALAMEAELVTLDRRLAAAYPGPFSN